MNRPCSYTIKAIGAGEANESEPPSPVASAFCNGILADIPLIDVNPSSGFRVEASISPSRFFSDHVVAFAVTLLSTTMQSPPKTPSPWIERTDTRTVLVTGGTGFLGSHIVDAVLEQHPEWKVTVLDKTPPTVSTLTAVYEVGDVTDVACVNAIVDKVRPDVIIHAAGLVPELAGRYGREQEARVFDVNVNGTRNMLVAAKNAGVGAFVWTGSCCAVTDDMRYQYANIDERWPVSRHSLIYGESKTAAERLVLGADDQKMATCALRPSVLFGPGDHQLIPSIYACIAKGESPFVIGDGENLWDVTYVGNVADAHVLAVENLLSSKTAAGEPIFLSNEEPITFRDFCLAIWSHFGHYPSFELHIPVSVAALAGCIAECVTWFTGTPATLSRGSVRDACGTRYCSGEKARKILGYRPRIGIEEGIRVSCEEYAQRMKAHEASKRKLTA